MVKKKVRIDEDAQRQLREIVKYIKNDSPTNANKVRDDIYGIAASIPRNFHRISIKLTITEITGHLKSTTSV